MTVPPSVRHEPWILERLKNPTMAAAYLEAAIEDRDPDALMMALRRVVQTQGDVSKVARRSRLSREAINRMLANGGNLELMSFIALIAGAGLRLSIEAAEGHAKKAA